MWSKKSQNSDFSMLKINSIFLEVGFLKNIRSGDQLLVMISFFKKTLFSKNLPKIECQILKSILIHQSPFKIESATCHSINLLLDEEVAENFLHGLK